MNRFASQLLITCLATFLVAGGPALGQRAPVANGPSSMYVGSNYVPPAELKSITVDEHLNVQLPLDLRFRDEAGQEVALRSFFTGKKPVVLQIGYFGCPMLCGLVTEGMVASLKEVPLTVGTDYEVVYLSIDPTETPALAHGKKQSYVNEYGRPGSAAGFHFLTTTSKQDIDAVCDAVGFRYQWIARDRQFAHPAVLAIATPEGKLSRYLYGVRFDSPTVRLSLVEASDGKVGTTADKFILTCFQYDGKQGKYAFAALSAVRAGGVLTVLVLGFFLTRFFIRERRARATPAGGFPVQGDETKHD